MKHKILETEIGRGRRYLQELIFPQKGKPVIFKRLPKEFFF